MPVDYQRFVESAKLAGLVEGDEWRGVEDQLAAEGSTGDAAALARELVRAGKLTKYQAAALYQDKGGTLVLGNYVLIDKLGAGGMGQVFRARHRKMDRVVALKVMNRSSFNASGTADRFQREVRAAAKLAHPNIVTAYDADEAGGTHFLVMECVEGDDLASIVKRRGPLPISQAIDYVRQAAGGLAHAHVKGIVHRDIKPSNLLVDTAGAVKILDMGLARFSDTASLGAERKETEQNLTTTGSIMGTIDYMSPEQAMDSRQVDGRSDIYSLGCTLFYLVTGGPPFTGDTIMKRLSAHQHAPPPALPGASAELNATFQRMVAKKPDDRFAQMGDCIAALDACSDAHVASGAPARPRPVTPVPLTPAPGSAITHGSNPGIPVAERSSPSIAAAPIAAPRRGRAMLLGGVALSAVAVAIAIVVVLRQRAAESTAGAPVVAAPKVKVAAAPTAVEIRDEDKPDQTSTTDSVTVADAPRIPAQPSEPVVVDAPSPSPPVEPVAAAPPSVATVTASMVAPEPTESTDARLAVPDAAALAQAEKLLDDILKTDLAAAKTGEAKSELAGRLIADAEAAENDPPGCYAMLCRARDLAGEVPDLDLVSRAIDALAARFEIDEAESMATALAKIEARFQATTANKSVAEMALERGDAAAAQDHWEIAKRLGDTAVAAARKSKDAALLKQAFNRGKELAAGKQRYEEFEQAEAVLSANSNDAAAHLVVGRYLCFVRAAWAEGFAHLAKSGDATLADLARRSGDAPVESDAQVELGDAWWDVGERFKGSEKEDLRSAAAYWYNQAVEKLTGLAKTRIEKRLAEHEASGSRLAVRATVQVRNVPAKRAFGKVPAANGLAIAETLDCSLRPHEFRVAPTFNPSDSWTLALEFMAPNFDSGSHEVLYCQVQPGRGPILLRLQASKIEARVQDSRAVKNFSIYTPLDPVLIGAWVSVVFQYEAPSRSLRLFVNGTLAAEEETPILPTGDGRPLIAIAGVGGQSTRFFGKVRNVWLGNGIVSPAPVAPAPSTPRNRSATANGLVVSDTLDCTKQHYEFPIGSTFDCSRSWTLRLEYLAPEFEANVHTLLFLGNNRSPGKAPSAPIRLSIQAVGYEACLGDSIANKPMEVLRAPIRGMTDRWISVVWRYDATAGRTWLYSDGKLAEEGAVGGPPRIGPASLVAIGGQTSDFRRFAGQIRNVWLGNEDQFVAPAGEPTSAPATGTSPPTRPAPPPPTGSPPPPPVPGPHGHFYAIFPEPISWTAAKARCEQMQGHLACIGTPEENIFLIDLIESQIGRGKLGTAAYKYWIGGYLTSGTWKWITGEPMTFSPNILPVNPDKPYLRHAGPKWLAIDDNGSGVVVGFVCEWDKHPPPPPPR